ncbi:hypothetical protein FCV25MIE_07447 [Fagus crenata]
MLSGGGAVIAVVDLMDRLEPPDLREQVLLHEESASQGLGSGRSAPSVPDPDSIHADPLMVETHGSTPPQIRIRAVEKLLHFDQIRAVKYSHG